MVLKLEESIAAVCAPCPGPLRVCEVVFESVRYLYAADSLIVILVEARPVSTVAASNQGQRTFEFELCQVWNAQDPIRCVRLNPSNNFARGALAICTDEGRGVLLMPTSATSGRAAAVAETSKALTLDDTGRKLPSMAKESVRWKYDDRLLNHLEWMESGNNLFLLGAGEKVSIWKLVDDSVQPYLQRTIALSGGGDVPTRPVCHFDVAPSGRFAATAGKYDRIVKVWNLRELSPHEGANVAVSRTYPCACVHDVVKGAGNILIWRENHASLRSFVLWKQFAAADFCSSPFNEDNESLEIRIRVFGLVNHSWAREAPKAVSSINEALLSESTVMDALCLFFYGYGSQNEARRNELDSQRMNSITQTNNKRLGDRTRTNGDFCIFRGASIPFTGISPKLSLLLRYSGLQEQLVDAHIYSVSSSDYQDQESGSTFFYIELLFQQKMAESYLYCARLKLQVENSSVGTSLGSMFYTVTSCEISVICSSMMSAMKEGDVQDALFLAANMIPRCESGWHADSSLVITNMGGRLNVFQVSRSLRKLEIACESKIEGNVGPVTRTALYEKWLVLYLLIGGKLHVAMIVPGGTPQAERVIKDSSMESRGLRRDSTLYVAKHDTLSVCCMDGSEDFEMLDELISVAIPESVKVKWSNSTMFMQPAITNPATDYSMAVGMHKGGKKLTEWVLSFEVAVSESFASSVQLFRKSTVALPEARLLGIATVPLLSTFEITLASFDTDSQLTLWNFADLDDLLDVKPAHRVDVGELIRMAGRARKSTEQRLAFKHFSFSSCGRVAVLFGGGDIESDDQICFLPHAHSGHRPKMFYASS